MKASEVIDGAIEAVTGNWCQGSLFTQEGQLCLRGALFVGAGAAMETVNYGGEPWMLDMRFNNYDRKACEKANAAVVAVLNGPDLPAWKDNVPTFNDDEGTTEEDVILTLKRARELVDE